MMSIIVVSLVWFPKIVSIITITVDIIARFTRTQQKNNILMRVNSYSQLTTKLTHVSQIHHLQQENS